MTTGGDVGCVIIGDDHRTVMLLTNTEKGFFPEYLGPEILETVCLPDDSDLAVHQWKNGVSAMPFGFIKCRGSRGCSTRSDRIILRGLKTRSFFG